ncbi:MAG: radical SAM protein [Crenarchaeota archaeon]|nr:radical SAM protein [Thermoproteota archaeon]
MFVLVSFGVTDRCVLKCPHCYRNSSPVGEDKLSFDDCAKIIDEISNIGTRLLIFSGGEPLLRKDIYDLVRYASSRGLTCAVATSGLLADDGVVSRLVESGLKFVAVSLDSTRPEIHDSFRGVRGLWERAVSAIRLFRDHGVSVQVNFTLCKLNRDDVVNMVDFCDKLGVNHLHIFHVVPVGRASSMYEKLKLDPRDVLELCLRAVEHGLGRLNVKPTCIPQFWPFLKMRRPDIYEKIVRGRALGCIAARSYIYVSPSGDVYPCPYLPYSLGSLRERSLREILSSIAVRRLSSRDLEGRCGLCKFRDICGGCRARAFSYSGNIFDEDPECTICSLASYSN